MGLVRTIRCEFMCDACAAEQAAEPTPTKKLEAALDERDRAYSGLQAWKEWSRNLHHEFKWLPETTWPDDTKGREKITHELNRLREMHRSFAGHVYVSDEKYAELSHAQQQLRRIQEMGVECPDCGGTGIGPDLIPYPGEPPETDWCPTCEGGGRVTKEYLRLRGRFSAPPT